MTAPLLAELTAGDLALVIVTGCAIVAVVAVLFALARLLVVLRRLTSTLDQISAEAEPLLDDLASSVVDANEQLERVDRAGRQCRVHLRHR